MKEWPIVGAIVAAVVGIYGWLIIHVRGHPTRKEFDNLVENARSAKFCDERSGSMNDCIEREVVERKEAYKQLREDMQKGFTELKNLICDGLNRR